MSEEKKEDPPIPLEGMAAYRYVHGDVLIAHQVYSDREEVSVYAEPGQPREVECNAPSIQEQVLKFKNADFRIWTRGEELVFLEFTLGDQGKYYQVHKDALQ